MPTLGSSTDLNAARARVAARLAYEASLEAKGVLRGSSKWQALTTQWSFRRRAC